MSIHTLHGVAALTHVLQSIVCTYLIYEDNGPEYSLQLTVFNKPVQEWKYSLSHIVPWFPLLSGVNHALSYVDQTTYSSIRKHNVNYLRWSEYSISAGIMLWIICSLCGIVDLKTLISISLMNAALQYVGYLIETAKVNNDPVLKHLVVLGFTIHISIWVQIFISFYSALSIADEKVPDIVYSIVCIMFLLFTSFGIWSCLWAFDVVKSFDILEIGYIILSFVSKTLLTWMVLFGVLRSRESNM